jgi:hypothetical protein
MVFRFYSNAVSQASRSIAAGIFIIGMVLIGFGFLIYLLPKLFAALAAIFFWTIGVGCGITAVKIFLASGKQSNIDPSDGYRENVQIRIEDHND